MVIESVRRKFGIFFGLVIFLTLWTTVLPQVMKNVSPPVGYEWLVGIFPWFILIAFIVIAYLKWKE